MISCWAAWRRRPSCKITVRDLATHSDGFDNAKPYMMPDPKLYFEKLYAKRPVRPRGEKFEYACSNFVYLGLIICAHYGLRLLELMAAGGEI